MRLLRTAVCFLLVLFCGFKCAEIFQGRSVPLSGVWIFGLALSLFLLILSVSGMDLCESYTAERFEEMWIKDRKKEKGLFYRDKPGCYAILIYRFGRILPFQAGYENVYVGQSLEVYRRVHNHLNRKGNGDVYADLRDGKHIEIEIYPCKEKELNDLERRLIRKYHAMSSYNRTAGGGTKRGLFRR